ncbi:ATP-dependent RNA helicase eIF4A [Selaginella moellendorffii]|uniref:ATP-dependent RNA helicase eIF4A n=1 Tax=Selaginella moellendorffii TaxID=88036 RepID=UPI000D1C85D4|nr:ATP-dependent RNA helicase eIF4A [Selaginella moellendorffii]|eukprot:XP_024531933.1 ATP-dependent RNA helicase eIF4A [Selaginella moellendorffii]
MEEHQWMLDRLDIVVASPQEARKLKASMTLLALVLVDDDNPEFFSRVMDLIESLLFFSLPVSLKPSPCRPAKLDVINYLAPWEAINMSKELLRAIELSLPEAACCSGFLDPCFCNAVQNFSVFRRNVVCQDWSGILAFMPGLIPDSTSTASIVLAPGHRIPQLLELLQAFVDGLGLFEVKVTYLSEPAIMNELSPGIVLGTPDRMQEALCGASTTWKPHRAVLVETNVLVSTQKVHVEAICSILWSRDVILGIHSLDPSPGVEDIVTRFCKGETSRIPRPAFTVSSVKHFYAAVKSASDKLSKLGEVWKLFRIRSDTVTVYCNSVSQVELVASGMERADFKVAATHTGMPQHCIEETNRAFRQRGLLLITNIIYSGRQHVINFDMPESADGYLARAGVHRILWTRKVVSICSELEVCLMHEFERSLGFEVDLLVAKDHRLNGKKPPRRKRASLAQECHTQLLGDGMTIGKSKNFALSSWLEHLKAEGGESTQEARQLLGRPRVETLVVENAPRRLVDRREGLHVREIKDTPSDLASQDPTLAEFRCRRRPDPECGGGVQ